MLLNTSLSFATHVCVSECCGSGKPHGSSLYCCVTASSAVEALAPRALRTLLSLWKRYWNLCAVVSWKLIFVPRFFRTVLSFLRHFATVSSSSYVMPSAWFRRCASTSCAHRALAPGSKKLETPALMSCLSACSQNQSLFRTIGPPTSPDMTLIRLIGWPDRKPLVPRSNCSRVTLLNCMASFSNVPTAEPLNTFDPLLVIRLIERPDD